MNVAGLAEGASLCGAVALQAAFLLKRRYSAKTAALIVVLSLPLLFLSVNSMNSFLTCDETYIVYESVNLSGLDSASQWEMGRLRTHDLLVGVPLSLLKSATGLPMDTLAALGKTLQWLLCFIVILLIVDLLATLSGDVRPSPVRHLLPLYAVLSFPVVNLSAKIITYDAFSLLFGALAVVVLARGLRDGSRRTLYAGVMVAALAAQEKLTASPVLWAAIVAAALAGGRLFSAASPREKAAGAAAATAGAVLLSLSVFIGTFFIVSLVRNGGFLNPALGSVCEPFLIPLWPVLRLCGTGLADNSEINRAALVDPSFTVFHPLHVALFFCCMVLGFLALTGAAAALAATAKKIYSPSRLASCTDWLLLTAVCAGVTSSLAITAFLAPAVPVQPGCYQPAVSFNGVFLHFGARSLPTHLLLSAGWAYAVFITAIPTALLLAAVAAAVMRTVLRREKFRGNLFLEISCCGALIEPLFNGLLQAPIGIRYFNIFLLIVLLRAIVDFTQMAASLEHRKQVVAAAVFCLALIVEVLPFRPLYAAFRPIWLNYPERYADNPCRGELNPSWMGWGEEVFLAGKKIQKIMRQENNPSLEDVRIYHNYSGEWLCRKNKARLIFMDSPADGYRYTGNDFYVLNRMGVTLSPEPFPAPVKPLFTISFRGFATAWVFRGTDLAAQGFSFMSRGRD